MNWKWKSLIVSGGLLVPLAMLLFGFVDFQNAARQYENQIEARYKDNQNVYDQGWKKVKEVAQVPEIYVDKVKEITLGAIQGRYGNQGAKQIFLAVQEVNPNIDASLYRQLQQVIEAFRNEFKERQTELISIKQQYKNFLTATYSGRFFNQFSGHLILLISCECL